MENCDMGVVGVWGGLKTDKLTDMIYERSLKLWYSSENVVTAIGRGIFWSIDVGNVIGYIKVKINLLGKI